MLLPNKTTTYSESVFPTMTDVLDVLSEGPIEVVDLYIRLKDKVDSATKLIDAIDVLFALNKIRLEGSVISYVD